MRHTIATIFDSKAKAYLTPFYLPNDAMAIRTFTDCINDPNHAFSKNPQDYTLFKLGTFDNINAETTFLESKEPLKNGIEAIDPKLNINQFVTYEEFNKQMKLIGEKL